MQSSCDRLPSPLDQANLLSRLTYVWLSPLFKVGAIRALQDNDIFHLPKTHNSKYLHAALRYSWEKEKHVHGTDASLMRATFWLNKTQVLGAVAWLALYGSIVVIQPYFVDILLSYFGGHGANLVGLHEAYSIAVLLGAISIIGAVLSSYGGYTSLTIGTGVRAATMSLIFEKSLKISHASKSNHTTGEIVTLMSADAERLLLGIQFFPWLFVAPLMIVFAMIFLVLEVGYSGIAAVGAVILINLFQTVFGRRIGEIRRVLVKFTEDRVKVMNECLQGIRVVKFYAWEAPLASRVNELRASELAKVLNYLSYKTLNSVSDFYFEFTDTVSALLPCCFPITD